MAEYYDNGAYNYGDTFYIRFSLEYPASAFPGSMRCYVRGFTGLTEDEAIDATVSAGGGFIDASSGTMSKTFNCTVFASGRTYSPNEKIYGRVEVYWPGYSQKEISYSKAAVLCGKGASNNTSDSLVVSLRGKASTRYLSYGSAMDTINKVKQNAWRVTTGFTEDHRYREIDVMGQTSSTSEFYKVFRAQDLCLNDYMLTASTANERYKTTKEVVLGSVSCVHETTCPVNTTCSVESCDYESGDCDSVCECDSETYCYNETCPKDCAAHQCSANITDICACYNSDDTIGCAGDNQFFYNQCLKTDIGCVFGGNIAGYSFGDFVAIDLPTGLTGTNMTYELDGVIPYATNAGIYTPVVTFTMDNQIAARVGSYADNVYGYNMLKIYSATTSNVSGVVHMYPNDGFSNATLAGVSMGTPFELIVGNRYIYNGSQLAFSGSPVSSVSCAANLSTLYLAINVVAISRFVIFRSSELVMDLRACAMNCDGNGYTFDTKYGFRDEVTGRFFRATAFSSLAQLSPCAALSIPGGSMLETDCILGKVKFNVSSSNSKPEPRYDNSFLYINLGTPVASKALKFEFKGALLTTGTYLGASSAETGNYHNALFAANSISNGYPQFRLGYKGTTTTNISFTAYSNKNVHLKDEVTLIISNKSVRLNNDSGTQLYYNSSETYAGMMKRLGINMGILKVEKLTVYSGTTMIAEYVPKVYIDSNHMASPVLYDNVSNRYVIGSNVNLDYCPPEITGGTGTGTYSLTCMNGPDLFYYHQYGEGETINRSEIGVPVKEGYTFTNWDPVIPATMPGENITATAQFVVNRYTITYYLKDASQQQTEYSVYTSVTYDYGATISNPTPTVPSGYEFLGWDIQYTAMPSKHISTYGDIEVYVPRYYVNFYSGSTSWGSTPSCSRFRTTKYAVGETISYPSVTGTCMTAAYGGWKLACTGGTNAPSTMPSNSIDVYYVLGYQTFTIYWRARKSDSTGSYTTYETQTAEYGDSISGGPDLSSYAPSGYHWNGWNGKDSFTMECGDKNVDGTFVKDAAVYYNVTFYVDGQYYTEQSNCAAGYPIDTVSLPTSDCYDYSAWSYSHSGLPGSMPSSNASGFTTSTPKSYDIEYLIDNGESSYEDMEAVSNNTAAANSTLSEPLPENNGWSYSSWSGIGWNYPTMPCFDAIAVTHATRILYRATFYKASGEYYSSASGYYGQTIPRPQVYTKTGYSVYWPVNPTAYTQDVSIYATEAVHVWTIRWMVDGDEWNASEYAYGAAITPLAPPNGYAWATTIPSTMPDNDLYIYATEDGTCSSDNPCPSYTPCDCDGDCTCEVGDEDVCFCDGLDTCSKDFCNPETLYDLQVIVEIQYDVYVWNATRYNITVEAMSGSTVYDDMQYSTTSPTGYFDFTITFNSQIQGQSLTLYTTVEWFNSNTGTWEMESGYFDSPNITLRQGTFYNVNLSV